MISPAYPQSVDKSDLSTGYQQGVNNLWISQTVTSYPQGTRYPVDKSARGSPENGIAVNADRVPCLDALEGEQACRAGIGEMGDVVHGTSWVGLLTTWPARGGPSVLTYC